MTEEEEREAALYRAAMTIELDQIDSVALRRIIEEVRWEKEQQENGEESQFPAAYDRVHNRHNRSGSIPYDRAHNRHNRGR